MVVADVITQGLNKVVRGKKKKTSAPLHALSMSLLSSVAMESSSSKPASADVAWTDKKITDNKAPN